MSAQRASLGVTIALTVTLSLGALLLLIALALLVAAPNNEGLGAYAALVNQQNQSAKTFVYVIAFAIVLPAASILIPRLADRLGSATQVAALLVASLAAEVVALRLADSGLKGVAVAMTVWLLAAAALLVRAIRSEPLLPPAAGPALWLGAGGAVLGALLCVTRLHEISVAALVASLALGALVLVASERIRFPPLRGLSGGVADLVIAALLVLAIPDLVLFHSSKALPTSFYVPGVIAFQHDWMLGPVNQLLHGDGALLAGVPVSQYGVGLLYGIAGWFHIAPIGYGTFGMLDALLTALFYAGGYAVLRIAGVGRLLAAGAIAFAVVVFVYHFQYVVGALPEQGPLRFGLPIVVVLAGVAAAAHERRRYHQAAALAAVGLSSVWAIETFAYTAVVYFVLAACGAWGGSRRRSVLAALGACLVAHLAFALLTLAGAGKLPDWGQYIAYLRAFLFGAAGSISYGFARWSPGLAVGAAVFASAAGVVLLFTRAREAVERQRPIAVALAGTTAFAVMMFSYSDNRSSTYLLPYACLPLLLAAVLWLALLARSQFETTVATRRGVVAFAACLAALMVAAAWPTFPDRFKRSALAHAYPNGGLSSGLRRLWHAPLIDPRAPVGERLLARYVPGRRVLIVLPTLPDLATEILMRSGKANSMFIGDPKADSLVPSVWTSTLRRQVDALTPGTRLLTDRIGLAVAATLKAHPSIDPLQRPLVSGVAEEEWLLQRIVARFRLVPIHTAADGLTVARLEAIR